MGVHHLAFATKDLQANDRFYTGGDRVRAGESRSRQDAQGLGETPLLLDRLAARPDDRVLGAPRSDPAASSGADISPGLGLPVGVNHLAFSADDLETRRRKERWLSRRHDVMEIDHDWCGSVYTSIRTASSWSSAP